MTAKGRVMPHAVFRTIAVAGLIIPNVIANVANLSDNTWLVMGTFVVTCVTAVAGGVVTVIKARQEGQKDEDRQALKLASVRIDTLEERIETAKSERLAAVAKAEIAEAKAHAAETAVAVAQAKTALETANLKAEILRLRQGQHDIRGSQQVITLAQAEMKADLAKRTPTPDPDKPMPVILMEDRAHPNPLRVDVHTSETPEPPPPLPDQPSAAEGTP